MIPIRDINPTHTRPVLVYGILAVNIAVFLVTLGDADTVILDYGAVPYHFTGAEPEPLVDAYGRELQFAVPRDDAWPLRTLTHFWLHAGWLHLLGNMWFLWVFGDNVEDALGRARFALLYVASALAALATQVVADPGSGIPMVGASGAIGGVLGAYLYLFPRARVQALVPLFVIFFLAVWPAWAFLLVWLGMQFFGVLGAESGTAWWAHIGGFVAGYLLAWGKRPPPPAWQPYDSRPRRRSARLVLPSRLGGARSRRF